MRKILLILFVLLASRSFSQLLDDSTKLVYGPQTTRFIYEKDILNNESDSTYYSPVDTSLYLFDQQSFIDRNRRKYQNLGNFGTALFPVFYEPQELIGHTSGFNAYAPYSRAGLDKIKYYETKSPFIDLFAYLGGGNKNLVRVDFSRNIRKQWNIGFDLHKITANKLISPISSTDRQTINTSFDIYTHYQNQKVPYQAVIYFAKLSHGVVENGGVRYRSDSTVADLFLLKNASTQLEDAKNQRSESMLHIYHDYRIADQFQLYHSIDIYDEENAYQDFAEGTSTGYDPYRDAYPSFLINSDTTIERATFSSITNEGGIKGDLSSVFYRAYIKLRTVDFNYILRDPANDVRETYLGGYARFNWRENFRVIAETEILQGGEYVFKGSLLSDLISINYQSKKYHVPYVYRTYFGNHFDWENNFTSVLVNKLEGSLKIRHKSLTLIPKASFTAYNNFLYFDSSQLPAQASDGIAITTIGGEVNLGFKNSKGEGVYFNNEILATNVSGGASDAVRIPGLFYNGRYYWSGLLFEDKVPFEIGIDTHGRSSYFATGYVPVTQQFYLQDEIETFAYFKADLFVNMRLDKFYAGIKIEHVDQAANEGYFVTPFYPGHSRSVNLIIRWTFFD